MSKPGPEALAQEWRAGKTQGQVTQSWRSNLKDPLWDEVEGRSGPLIDGAYSMLKNDELYSE